MFEILKPSCFIANENLNYLSVKIIICKQELIVWIDFFLNKHWNIHWRVFVVVKKETESKYIPAGVDNHHAEHFLRERLIWYIMKYISRYEGD